MRAHRHLSLVALFVITVSFIAVAQSPKAGLYEVTSKMTWQQSPFPAGMQAPPGSGEPHSSQVCVTQAQIDKYSGPKPQARGGCEIHNIQKHEAGMTAEITCGAPMTGKGKVETNWVDSGHSKSKVHFNGSMQMGQDTKTIEWTVESDSTFKSADCGSVKPAGPEK
jgi:hypothetical protein